MKNLESAIDPQLFGFLDLLGINPYPELRRDNIIFLADELIQTYHDLKKMHPEMNEKTLTWNSYNKMFIFMVQENAPFGESKYLN